MNTELVKNNTEKLESVFLNMMYLKPEDRIIAPDMSILGDLKDAINNLFDENQCINVIYTNNTDKPFFGVRINPAISPSDAITILSTDEEVRLNKYQIEFDSKLFSIGLTGEELAAVTVYEISNMMDNNGVFENLRASIDAHAVHDDDIIRLRDSVNFAQLIIFAMKDTMYKYSSIIFVQNRDDLLNNVSILTAGYQDYVESAFDKISSHISGIGDSMRYARPIILEWMFLMIKDIRTNNELIIDTLKDAKSFTGSKLEIAEIDKTITALDHIDMSITETYDGTDLNKFFEKKNLSSLNELSIFKNLKKNGLRGIENELYEFAMRVKNCADEDEAYLIMRGINSRIGILEDYLANERLSKYDYNHWTDICNRYRQLRDILAAKKFNNRQFGLFYDYSKVFDDDKEEN